jgi:hypothetical protein
MADEHCDGPSKEEFNERYRQALDLLSNPAESISVDDLPCNLSETAIRGLEPKVFPETVTERRGIVRKVVAAQDRLPEGLAPEQQSKLLRAVSQNLTRRSRLLARLYGMGDANVAAMENC